MKRKTPKSAAKGRASAKRPAKKQRLELTVCKPCWELKYCPYGPLVEYFPLSPETQPFSEVEGRYRKLIDQFARGEFKTEAEILEATERLEYHYLPRWQWIQQYETSELACSVFGHICPVFFTAEGFTETKDGRRSGRYIPRDLMLQVVRRDGQICRICQQPVPDDEVEFDHRIPFSKGGPMSADNIRLVCRKCNRKKRDTLKELLWEPPPSEASGRSVAADSGTGRTSRST